MLGFRSFAKLQKGYEWNVPVLVQLKAHLCTKHKYMYMLRNVTHYKKKFAEQINYGMFMNM